MPKNRQYISPQKIVEAPPHHPRRRLRCQQTSLYDANGKHPKPSNRKWLYRWVAANAMGQTSPTNYKPKKPTNSTTVHRYQ